MKRFVTRNGNEFYVTKNVTDVLVNDYEDGAILYAQEKMFEKDFYVVDIHQKPIGDDRLLRAVSMMDLAV